MRAASGPFCAWSECERWVKSAFGAGWSVIAELSPCQVSCTCLFLNQLWLFHILDMHCLLACQVHTGRRPLWNILATRGNLTTWRRRRRKKYHKNQNWIRLVWSNLAHWVVTANLSRFSLPLVICGVGYRSWTVYEQFLKSEEFTKWERTAIATLLQTALRQNLCLQEAETWRSQAQ